MTITEINNRLSTILLPEGFRKKGSAFFRVQGDGVLIVIRFRMERNASYFGHPHYILELGLFSLYSELLPAYFTSRGCIPQYHILEILGERDTCKLVDSGIKSDMGREILMDFEYTPDDQLTALKNVGIEFIRNITSQAALLQAMYQLDQIEYGEIYGLDMQKYAPLLYLGNNEEAADIIRKHMSLRSISIEEQDDISAILTHCHTELEKKEAISLFHKLTLATSENRDSAIEYLRTNYKSNLRHWNTRRNTD